MGRTKPRPKPRKPRGVRPKARRKPKRKPKAAAKSRKRPAKAKSRPRSPGKAKRRPLARKPKQATPKPKRRPAKAPKRRPLAKSRRQRRPTPKERTRYKGKPPRPTKPDPRPGQKAPRGPAKVSVFVGASLDGFIARENGELDFLEVPGDPKQEDYGYKVFFGEIDAVVMGRRSFEKVLSFKSWPYGKTPVFVLATRPPHIPRNLWGKVETMADRPTEIVGRLAKRGLRRLYIDGGRTIQGFLRAGVVDEITITQVPVLLGKGVPLFGALPSDVRLKHVQTRTFPSGMVQSTYAVRRARKGPAPASANLKAEVKARFGAPAAPAAFVTPAAEAPEVAALEALREPESPPAPAAEYETAPIESDKGVSPKEKSASPAHEPDPDPPIGQIGEAE